MIIDRVDIKGLPFYFAGAVEQIEFELMREAKDQNKFDDRIEFGLQFELKQITQDALLVVAFLSQKNLGSYAYIRASLKADKESSEIVVDALDDRIAPAWEVVKNKLAERGWIGVTFDPDDYRVNALVKAREEFKAKNDGQEPTAKSLAGMMAPNKQGEIVSETSISKWKRKAREKGKWKD